jgi:hypothetical protein
MINTLPIPNSILHLISKVEDRSNSMAKRVMITFKNGYSLSVIHGEFTYGASKGLLEIAAINKDGELDGSLFDEENQGDTVLGSCTPEMVNHYIDKIAKL